MEKQEAASLTETHIIEGHTVEIRRNGKEELWIDGIRRKFFVYDDGYNLFDDAYAPPQRTLLKAVEAYLRNA